MRSAIRTRRRRPRGERGAAALEWVLLAPLIVAVIGAMVAGWRLQSARAGAEHAAQAGARAASWERAAGPAAVVGERIARGNLAATGCSDPSIYVDTAGFQIPAGQPAAVRVTVGCAVRLSDLLVPGLPGSIAVHAEATTPLDRYRGRG